MQHDDGNLLHVHREHPISFKSEGLSMDIAIGFHGSSDRGLYGMHA